MTLPPENNAAGQYAAAQAAHYTTRDLRKAIDSYHRIIAAHPASPEASYSRTQILNIANRLISKDVLLETHRTLALAALAEGSENGITDAASTEATSG